MIPSVRKVVFNLSGLPSGNNQLFVVAVADGVKSLAGKITVKV
jgi:hypothetical protein